MTTFQQFKRSVRSSSSQIKPRTQHSNFSNAMAAPRDPTLQNLVTFSSSQINFTYSASSGGYVTSLRITNLTGDPIHYKIRSNNARQYAVVPYEEVIPARSDKEVKFELRTTNDVTERTRDKFQIMWGRVPYNPSQKVQLSESRIFTVVFEIVQTARQQHNNFAVGNKLEKSSFQEANSYFERSGVQQQHQEAVSYANEYQQHGGYHNLGAPKGTLLTKYNLIMVSAMSFVLGFILS